MSSHYNKFLELLNKTRIDRSGIDDIYSHVGLGGQYTRGCYNIPDKDLGKFYQLYSKVITEGTCPVYLAERHRKQGPVLIDLDFKYKTQPNSDPQIRIIKESDWLVVIEQYIINIKKYIKLDDLEEDLKCYVLTKPNPTIVGTDPDTNSSTCKDGLHIMFPNICTQPLVQHLIRENVINFIRDNSSWAELNLSNEPEDVIDKAVIEKNCWLLYGSCKDGSENNKYELSKIFTVTSTNTLEQVDFDNSDIIRLPETLSIRRFSSDAIFPYVEGYDEQTVLDEYNQFMKTNPTQGNYSGTVGKPTDIALAAKLVQILSPKRADKYDEWLNLGFCLHNIDDSLLESWNKFSSQSKKFEKGECEKLWIKFKNIGYGIGSLIKWAQHDDFDKYMDIMIEFNFDTLSKSVSGQPYDVAKSFFELYKHQFRIGSVDFKEWYYFDTHKWTPMQDAYIIKDMLNEDFVNAYVRLGLLYGKKALKAEGDEKQKLISKQELIMKISTKLRGPFKKQVIEELTTLYKKLDPDFTNKLDENKNLICFTNGVYDLENAIFREGRPEDYITLCTNNRYISFEKINKSKLHTVRKFLVDIQPEEDVRNYILDLFASCLAGHNADQKFNIWTGSGSNGKSVLINLMMDSLGDYSCGLPPEVLTRASTDPDKASPTMAKTKGKRFVVFEEPEGTDQVYVGKMKAYSGNVKIQARKLHKDIVEFYPQFKMFLLCNKLPTIPSNDGGTWRRIRLVPFEMKFVDNPIEDYERQIDRGLEDLLRLTCREEFLSMLIERYAIYKTEGLKVPPKVMLSTENYQSNSDIFLDYINECIEFTDDLKDRLDFQDLVADMQYWMKNVKFDKRVEKIFQRGDFKSDLEEKLGRLDSTGSYWRRYVLRSAMKNSGKIIMDEDNIDMKGNELNDMDDDEERKTLVIKLSTYEKIRQSKIKRKKTSKKVEEIQDGILISS
jgi:P4 family phage/plasmid primase-like protien